jgi:hypothetical protein
MKNITLTVDDETYRIARVRAAELGTSVSAMVKDYLNGLTDDVPPKPQFQGVREMPMPYIAQPAAFAPIAAKPRVPGSLKGMIGLADDLGEWPPEMQAFFEQLQDGSFEDAFDALP